MGYQLRDLEYHWGPHLVPNLDKWNPSFFSLDLSLDWICRSQLVTVSCRAAEGSAQTAHWAGSHHPHWWNIQAVGCCWQQWACQVSVWSVNFSINTVEYSHYPASFTVVITCDNPKQRQAWIFAGEGYPEQTDQPPVESSHPPLNGPPDVHRMTSKTVDLDTDGGSNAWKGWCVEQSEIHPVWAVSTKMARWR